MGHILDFLFNKNKDNTIYEDSSDLHTNEPSIYTNPYEKDVDININEEKKRVFDEIISNPDKNYFITGKAGTGKSTLLRYLRANTDKMSVTVAPTGIAALVVEGVTIHSMFRIPPQLFVKDESLDPLVQKQRKVLNAIEILIIDEISMVRSDLMDAIDIRMKEVKQNDLPFGGVQVVMFGDLFQLPPVVTDKGVSRYLDDIYGSRFFFDSDTWNNVDMKIVELQDVFRQKDEEFVQILDSVRHGEITGDLLNRINARYIPNLPENEKIIVLATINQTVTMVNNKSLEELSGEEKVFQATVTGNMKESEFPTDSRLRLKIDAQVMILVNDTQKKYVNGTIGKVTGFNVDSTGNEIIFVEVDGVSHAIKKKTWEKKKYIYDEQAKKISSKPISSFTQFPLRLAWAITIHKSQGQTIDGSVLIDLTSGTFEGGQAYVALSRIRDLNKMYLRGHLKKEDFKINSEVAIFLDKHDILSFSNEYLNEEKDDDNDFDNQTIETEDEETPEQREEMLEYHMKEQTEIKKEKEEVRKECGDIDVQQKEKSYSVEEIRKKYPNAYEPWTSEDDERLWKLYKKGMSIDELMNIFKRQKGGIKSRLNKLEEIVEKSKKKIPNIQDDVEMETAILRWDDDYLLDENEFNSRLSDSDEEFFTHHATITWEDGSDSHESFLHEPNGTSVELEAYIKAMKKEGIIIIDEFGNHICEEEDKDEELWDNKENNILGKGKEYATKEIEKEKNREDYKLKSGYDFFVNGNMKLKQRNFQVAVQNFDKAISLDFKNSPVYNNRGVAQIKQNNIQKAMSDFSKAIMLNPENADAHYNQGIAQIKQNNIKEAIESYNKAIALNLQSAQVYYYRGNAKEKIEDLHGAIEDYGVALKLNPDYGSAMYDLAIAKEKQEKGMEWDIEPETEDKQYFNSVINIKNIEFNRSQQDAYTYYEQGIVKYTEGDLDGALQDFDKAIELGFRYSSIYYKRGIIKSKQKNLNSAIEDYNKAIELNPQDVAYTYYARGFAKDLQGDLLGAIQDFDKAKRLNPTIESNYSNCEFSGDSQKSSWFL